MKPNTMPIYSRYGRETKNYHNEFMKMHSQDQQSKIEDVSLRIQPKVDTNRNFSQPNKLKGKELDAVKEMVELNMHKLMQNQAYQEINATSFVTGGTADYVTDK